MRVTDNAVFLQGNTRVMKARQQSQEAGDRVASGRRIEHPWDGAADAGLMTRFEQDQRRYQSIFDASQRAAEELNAVDGAFDQIVNSLTQAQQLATQLASDTYNAQDRLDGANEAQQLLGVVVSQLNVRFGDRYLFGGTRDAVPPFDATGAYLGDTAVRTIEIAPGVYQEASIRADQAFKGVGGGIDITAELTAFSTALGSNDANRIRQSVQNLGDAIQQVTQFRSRGGAMVNVFDIAANTARLNKNLAEDGHSKLADVDIFEATTRFASAERALEASMTAVAKSFKLSLLDKL